MKLWIPTFDGVMKSLASAHVWVMILNMLFHFLGKPSLKSIRNALGKTLNHYYTTIARICLEMDFDKSFPSQINLNGRNFQKTQKMTMNKLFLGEENDSK